MGRERIASDEIGLPSAPSARCCDRLKASPDYIDEGWNNLGNLRSVQMSGGAGHFTMERHGTGPINSQARRTGARGQSISQPRRRAQAGRYGQTEA